MAISPLYIPLFTIEEVILDKDSGLPLSGGVVTFFRDSQRLQPKVVYQIQGTSPNYTFASVGNELTLGLNGSFVDDDGDPFVPYAYPYDADGNVDLYYVTVVSEGGVPQFTREAVPYISSGVIPPGQRTNTENELSNPQFVEVSFSTDSGAVTISVTGSNTVTPIAPGWDLITSGTGNVIVQRLEPTSANIDTNPPYTLSIAADSGLGASVTLRQRLNNSPSLLRGGFASGSLIAAVLSGGGSTISMSYAPSTGTPTTIIANTAIDPDGDYHIISGNAAIPEQANTAASTGYADINILIPTSRTIAISSIQVVGIASAENIPFDEQSAARQKDHLFHYYENALVRQPKANLLTGWTFGLNPWQFRDTTLSNVANNTYTADQTIIIQQAYVTSATANNVAVGRASHTANYAFQIQAVTANNKTMMLQYIDPSTIRPYWGEKLSVRLRGSITTSNATVPRFKVRLMYKSGLPGTLSQTVPVSVWTDVDDSIPTVSGDGWTYITSTNDPTYSLTGTVSNFDFDGFQLPASDNANMTIGIAFIMMNALVQTGTADIINIERLSLVRNDFAIDADPETYDEAMRKCEFYYEKSYANGVLPAAITPIGERYSVVPLRVSGGSSETYYKTFEVIYNNVKRVAPTMTFYSPLSATPGLVQVSIRLPSSGTAAFAATTNGNGWTAAGASERGVIMFATSDTMLNSIAANAAHEGVILYHYVADARLAI